jgi:hypothetical protein
MNASAGHVARPVEEPILAAVRRALGALRYGSVTLVVRDGMVVQVETTAKVRLTDPQSARAR